MKILIDVHRDREALRAFTRNLGYELASANANKKPALIRELKHFNAGDKIFEKDVFRFSSRK